MNDGDVFGAIGVFQFTVRTLFHVRAKPPSTIILMGGWPGHGKLAFVGIRIVGRISLRHFSIVRAEEYVLSPSHPPASGKCFEQAVDVAHVIEDGRRDPHITVCHSNVDLRIGQTLSDLLRIEKDEADQC
jgi:hypothetical protein